MKARIIKRMKVEKGLIKGALKWKGGIAKKWKFYRLGRLAIKRGVVSFRIERIAGEYTKDYYEYQGASKAEKKWVYGEGILSHKIASYGITKENIQNYMSDFEFYKWSNYANQEFSELFDHKLNTFYLLNPFKEHMPRHHYFIYKGKILPIGGQNQYSGTWEDVVALAAKGPLALKASRGGSGKGFCKLVSREGSLFCNDQEITKGEAEQLIRGLEDYIVTDYIRPHSMFRKLFGEDSFAVLRVVMVYDENDGPQMTGATLRIGCSETGIVTDKKGTIYCGVNLQEGKLFGATKKEDEDMLITRPCPRHPDTDVEINGNAIPHWEDLKSLVSGMSSFLPMLPYLVMDIIPDESGFKVLEINSHGQVRIIELFYPFWENKYNRRLFGMNHVTDGKGE